MRAIDMSAWRIAGIYLALGAVWVVGSDLLLAWLAPDVPAGQAAKGLAFVGLSGLLIYVLMARSFAERQREAEERSRLQRQLAAAARFEAIGQLANGIAHDFNNLLTAISGNIEGYLRQLPPEARAEELSEAIRSTDRAAQLTRQLLTFGRRQVMHPELVDINAVIRDMSTLLHRLIGDRVRIVSELGPDLRAVVVDRSRLEQVVMNLAINARDAMPAGGKLYLRTSNERLGRQDWHRFPFPIQPGRYIRLDVEDSGVGMTEDVQAHIFEPFYTTKSKEVGTGLGLATVYGIVKQSGGYITFRSEPDAGSSFSVFLPEAVNGATPTVAKGGASEPVADTDPDDRGSETVLVVEDDRAVRALITRILARRGFAVLEAPDGPEALAMLRELNGQVDLVVTDATMPQMTGLELAEAIRARDPRLPVLLVSGHGEDAFRGTLPFLAKPFTHDQLSRRVRELLDARAQGSAE